MPISDPTKAHKTQEWVLDRPLLGVRFDPKSRYVVTGAQNNLVQRWNITDGARVDLAGHDSWVRAIAFSSDGETLISGSYDGRIIYWPLAAEKPEPARKIDAHQGWVRALAVSPDGLQLASCGNDNLVKVWSLADGALLHTLAGHERHVYNVAFHPAGGQLVSADLMGVFKHWDLATGQATRTLDGKSLHSYDKTFWADMGGARGMAFSADGKLLAASGVTEVSNAFAGQGEAMVALFDWEKGAQVQAHKVKDKFVGVGWSVYFHPDGYLLSLFSGHGGGTLAFFKPDAAEAFTTFKLPTQGHDAALSPDGLTVAVGQNDSKLRLYRLAAPAA